MKGSCHYDKRGKRWLVSIYWGGNHYRIWKHPITGEPFWHKKSAEKQLGKIRTEIDEKYFNPKHWVKGNPLLVRTYALEWLEKIDISPNTMRGYKAAVDKYLVPFLGDKDIRHIRYDDIVDLRNCIVGVGDKRKKEIIATLKTMLNYALKCEDIQKVPPFPKLSYQEPEIEYLDMKQQEAVLSHIPNFYRPIFQFMMEYGCRPSEARALKWDCVSDKIIIIKRAFSDNRLNEYTKTKDVRYEEMTDYIRDILKQLPIHISGFVFLQKNGKPYHQNQLQQIWKKAQEKAGINLRLYNSTRHSLGCQLLDMGYDMDLVREQLGHSRSDMTRRYAKRSVSIRGNALKARRSNIVEFKKKENIR